MSPFKVVLLAGITLLLTEPALAQTVGEETDVRVYTNFNVFVPAPSGDTDEARKARDNARRSIYEMARRECDLLREVLEGLSPGIAVHQRQPAIRTAPAVRLQHQRLGEYADHPEIERSASCSGLHLGNGERHPLVHPGT